MNENKRFTLREPKVDENIGCSEIASNGQWITYGEIVGLLNENEKLKSICQDHRDHAHDFKADCGRLEKENEELKKENNNLKKALWEAEENYLYQAYHNNSARREDKLKDLKEDFKRGYWND